MILLFNTYACIFHYEFNHSVLCIFYQPLEFNIVSKCDIILFFNVFARNIYMPSTHCKFYCIWYQVQKNLLNSLLVRAYFIIARILNNLIFPIFIVVLEVISFYLNCQILLLYLMLLYAHNFLYAFNYIKILNIFSEFPLFKLWKI